MLQRTAALSNGVERYGKFVRSRARSLRRRLVTEGAHSLLSSWRLKARDSKVPPNLKAHCSKSNGALQR